MFGHNMSRQFCVLIQWILVSVFVMQITSQPNSSPKHSRPYISDRPRPAPKYQSQEHYIPVSYPVDHWPNCTIANNVHGTCKKIVHCPDAVTVILRGYHPPICYWERYKTFPLVCCPSLVDGSLNDVLPPKPNNGFKYEYHGLENSLTCGINAYSTRPSFEELPIDLSPVQTGFSPAFRKSSINPGPLQIGGNRQHLLPEAQNIKVLVTKNQERIQLEKSRTQKEILIAPQQQTKKWPWMVTVYDDEAGFNYMCNGFLIDNRHILTAAQTLSLHREENRRYSIRIGGKEEHGSLYQVSKVTIHQEYKSWAQYNDLAVLELKNPIIDSGISPLCLPSGNVNVKDIAGFKATVLGHTAYEEVPIVSHSWCEEMYSKYSPLTYPRGIPEQFLCAGLQLHDNADGGVGDLGGPVMIRVNNRWVAIGMVSLDYKCAKQGFPGIYTNLAEYTDWIRNAIK